jgi:hypothetical protein
MSPQTHKRCGTCFRREVGRTDAGSSTLAGRGPLSMDLRKKEAMADAAALPNLDLDDGRDSPPQPRRRQRQPRWRPLVGADGDRGSCTGGLCLVSMVAAMDP